MLRGITLRNFKPFGGAHHIPLSKINLIYGPNSGGKTSIIQALLLLKQTQETNDFSSLGLVTRGPLTDLGSFSTLIHKHDINLELGIGLTFVPQYEPDSPVLSVDLSFVSEGSGTSSYLRDVTYGMPVGEPHDKFALSLSDRFMHQFSWSSKEDADAYADFLVDIGNLQRLGTVEISNLDLAVALQESRVSSLEYKLPHIIGQDAYSPDLDECGRSVLGNPYPPPLPDELYKVASEPLTYIARNYTSRIHAISYLGPMRSPPERIYAISEEVHTRVGALGEYTPHVLASQPWLLDEVNSVFQDFDIPYRIGINALGSADTGEFAVVTLIDNRTGTRVTPVDVGYGINQLLPIIVAGLGRGTGTICVEQPEVHLHPRLQASIADMMINSSIGGRNKQWIVETHSELLVRRILRRIEEGYVSHREGSLKPSDVSIIYIDPQEDHGSSVDVLRISEDGSFLDDWPHGFFVEAFNEIMRG